MNKSAIKDLVYGGMTELMKNKTYYYHSSVGANYGHWTEHGKEALTEFMNLVAGKMYEAEQADLDSRAKQQVLDQLKAKS